MRAERDFRRMRFSAIEYGIVAGRTSARLGELVVVVGNIFHGVGIGPHFLALLPR